jgi:polyketide biosynthesis acyl carrier protein
MQDREARIATVRRTVLEVITEILPDVPETEVTQDTSLRDLGADSTERVEIILALQDRLGNDQELSSFMSIDDVAGLISHLSRDAGEIG